MQYLNTESDGTGLLGVNIQRVKSRFKHALWHEYIATPRAEEARERWEVGGWERGEDEGWKGGRMRDGRVGG